MEIVISKNDICLPTFLEEQPLNLKETLDCGQCFRFSEMEGNHYQGVVQATLIDVEIMENKLYFHNTTMQEFEDIIRPYFDLDRDYQGIQKLLSRNPTLRKAIAYAPGIRVLCQEPWETLCTFLFSQNNNIKRITGIVDRFCQEFGEEIAENLYAFPTVEKTSTLNREKMSPVRAGFREKYILDAAEKVESGQVNLSLLSQMPLEEAQEYLQQISGVGPKVADCVLLFGGGHPDAFPKDVWINRAMAALFPKGLPKYALPYAGIAQQYIFHYIRTSPDCEYLRIKKEPTKK